MGSDASGRKGRARDLLVTLGVAALGAALLVLVNSYLQRLGDRALGGEWATAVTEMRWLLIGASVLLGLSSAGLGLLLLRMGAATCSEARFPPRAHAGVNLGRPRDGEDAVRLGRLLRRIGPLVAAIGVGAGVFGILVATRL